MLLCSFNAVYLYFPRVVVENRPENTSNEIPGFCHKSRMTTIHNGATENAGVENTILAKLQGWKMQEWKMQDYVAGVENAGVSCMERHPDFISRKP